MQMKRKGMNFFKSTSCLVFLLCFLMAFMPVTANAQSRTIRYEDGDIYKGSYKEDDTIGYYKNGKGTYYCSNGTVIKGTWKEDYLTGKATVKYKNKDKYVGSFKEDVRSGRGKYSFKNGDVYQGSWKNDYMSGNGVYRFRKGAYIKGKWLKGKLNGTCTFKSGRYKYKLKVSKGKLKKVYKKWRA